MASTDLYRVPVALALVLMLAACATTSDTFEEPRLAAIPATPAAPEAAPPAPVEKAPAQTSEPASTPKAAAKSASAAGCNDPRNFPTWLEEFKQEAAAQGIAPQVIEVSLTVKYDTSVISKDRNQDHFSKPFSEFAGGKVGGLQLIAGRSAMSKNSALLGRIEKEYGVPPSVLTALWGQESVYGTYTGNSDVIRSLATLAFDCRRPELFRPQLMSALKIVQRGDLKPSQMRGAWAGEMGQTQFMASDYYENSVDYDGDGKRHLKDSSADALASTANLLSKWGWKRGEPWIQEVKVPAVMDWKQADLAIELPRAKWAEMGVTQTDGSPLKSDTYSAALVLPMGRNGPAFLAYPNFNIFLRWNESLVYSLTVAYFATRLDGAPAFQKGNGTVETFDYDDIVALQKLLVAHGYDVGEVDGKLGAKSRAAVKDMQIKLNLPADFYPSPELLRKLQET